MKMELKEQLKQRREELVELINKSSDISKKAEDIKAAESLRQNKAIVQIIKTKIEYDETMKKVPFFLNMSPSRSICQTINEFTPALHWRALCYCVVVCMNRNSLCCESFEFCFAL